MAATSRKVAAVDVHEEPVDFDADALIAEAGREPFTFRFAREVWTLPPAPDIRAVARWSDGDMTGALAFLLGDEQWQHLLSIPDVLDAFVLKGIMDRYAEHAGLSSGNSSASTPPSGRTVAPSRRTSNGSTASR